MKTYNIQIYRKLSFVCSATHKIILFLQYVRVIACIGRFNDSFLIYLLKCVEGLIQC